MEKIYKLKAKLQKPKEFKINYEKELNFQQFEIVKNYKGPSLVIAGPGSGKTRVLVYRVAYLVENGINPKNILLATFTNKAARDMLFKIESLLGFYPKGLWGGTFHHICNVILHKYSKYINIPNNFTIIDEQEAKDFIKSLIKDLDFKKSGKYFPSQDIIQEIISYARNSCKKIKDVIEEKYPYFDEIKTQIIELANYYKKRKQTLNIMDFDDLLIYTLKLLKECKEIKEKLSKNFLYVLVDEFQDTNKIQAELVYELSYFYKNITVVGDDCQSIYSFRAATVENILEFPKRFRNARIFKLEKNYRSTIPILKVTNNILENIKNKFDKKLYSDKKSKVLPKVIRTKDVMEQAEFIAQRILELKEERNLSLNDIAVLFRSSYQSLELELVLNKYKIPYIKRGGIKFFEQRHIKDVLAFLKILTNPNDEFSFIRALTLFQGIGIKTAQKIFKNYFIKKIENIKLQKGKKISFEKFLKIFKKIEKLKKPSKVIEIVFDNFYKDYIIFNFNNPQERINDIKELINFSQSFKSIKKFLDQATLDENFKGETILAQENNQEEFLTLTTIHQAKGLEWQVVFLIHLNEGHFPHPKSIEDDQDLDEERRLFYVATSRAKDDLYYIYFETYKDFKGYTVFSQPSRFLEELDPSLFEVWNVK